MRASGRVIAWPTRWLSVPCNTVYLVCAPLFNSPEIWDCSPIIKNATMIIFLHLMFFLQLFPWDNFPGTMLLGPKLWMIFTALENRLADCPANCGLVKLRMWSWRGVKWPQWRNSQTKSDGATPRTLGNYEKSTGGNSLNMWKRAISKSRFLLYFVFFFKEHQ